MYDRILVPLALDHEGKHELSLKAAKTLLNPNGKITLLTVIEDIPTYAQAYMPIEILQDNSAVALKTLTALAQSNPSLYETALVHGKPSVEILEHANNNGAECIVIASHKPGLEDYFLGSNAARVVRHAKCCVHVLR